MKKFKSIYFEITTACNLSCPFCPSRNGMPYKKMDLDNFKRFFDETYKFADGIYFHLLGEPLMHKDFFEIVSYAKCKGVNLNLTTNGRLIPKYMDEIINADFKIINISLQSLITETEDDIKEYLESLKTFLIKRDEKGLKGALHLRLWNDKTKADVSKLNNYIIKEIERLQLLSFKNVNLMESDEFTWPQEEKDVNSIRSKCLGGKSQLAILPNGDVVICCLDYEGKTKIGNLLENSLDSILDSKIYKDVIKGWNDLNPYFDLCKKCTFRNRFKQ